MKTEEGRKREKKQRDAKSGGRQHGGTPTHAAGLLMSAQIEAGIIISV